MATAAEVAERYPQFAAFINHGTIGPLLQEAADNGYSAAELQGKLYATDWWKKTWADARSVQVLQATDPAEYEARRKQAAVEVRTLFADLGISWEKHAKLGHGIAAEWLKRGKDDWFLYDEIGKHMAADGGLVGDEGSLAAKAAKYGEFAADMLLDIDQATLKRWAVAEWRRMDSPEAIQNRLRQQAIAQYGHMAEELKRGLTVRELLSPITNTVAKTLEMNPDQIDYRDPRFRQLVEYRDPEKGARMMTTSEAERWARRQDEYQYTKGARDQVYAVGREILESMGKV